jgi:transketolase
MKLDNLYLIVDRNMVQTDREVSKILDMRSIEDKLKAFGWEVISINGNDCKQVKSAFEKLEIIKNRPKAIISNTVKGKGVSLMEHTNALKKEGI